MRRSNGVSGSYSGIAIDDFLDFLENDEGGVFIQPCPQPLVAGLILSREDILKLLSACFELLFEHIIDF
jgi:hypothetical protein